MKRIFLETLLVCDDGEVPPKQSESAEPVRPSFVVTRRHLLRWPARLQRLREWRINEWRAWCGVLATRLVVCTKMLIAHLTLADQQRGSTMGKITDTRYGSIAQFFHWCTAILVLVAFMYGPGGPEQRVYSSVHEFDRRLHETLGLCVFTLAVIRLLWRTIDARPEAPPVSRWMRVMATVVQGLLYMLLLALPLTAVAGAWLEGHPLTLIAGVEIPPLLGASHNAGGTFASVHKWLGDAIM
ncbi:cytochrome b [Paraburkholderia sp. RL17-373-BIF-A]|uniref:cytochrome b n=1 Tax=Paraburkholderia sp. RL17-373-BIF-A TaxID=3031629 RepID=UPI0038BA8356